MIELTCPDCGHVFYLRPRQRNSGHLGVRTRCGACRIVRRRRKSAAYSAAYRQRRRQHGIAPVQRNGRQKGKKWAPAPRPDNP